MFKLQRPSPVELSLEQLFQCRFIPFHHPRQRSRHYSSQAGSYVSNIRGRGMEFDEVRRYQAGDDIRYIDWRVTARTGKTHSKLFREERDRSVMISVDLTPSMYFGSGNKLKAMMATELAAIIGWQQIEQRQRTGLQLIGHEPEVTPMLQQAKAWLQALAQLQRFYTQQLEELQQPSQPNDTLANLIQYCPSGADLHLISDFYHYSDSQFDQLSYLAATHQVSLWQITDPFEFELPKQAKGRLPVEDGQHSGWLLGQSKKFREQYQQKANARQQKLIESATRVSLPFYSISTLEDWDAYF